MQQLSGLDTSFLSMETGTQFGHVGSLTLYEPAGRSLYDALRETLPERLHLLPPFRRRLVEVPFGIDHPYWIEDPNFDLDFHLRHIAVPPPGTDHQLADLVARLHSRPMDRGRPLWEITVIEGLSNGLTGLYIKIHHCTIDGVSGVELTQTLLDRSPEGAEIEPPKVRWTPERIPSDVEMLTRGFAGLAMQPAKGVRLAVKTMRNLQGLMLGISAVGGPELPWPLGPRGGPQVDAPAIPQTPAPKTSFNRSITPHRRFAFVTVSLDDARHVKRVFGTTLNDVVMAISSAALRRYLQKHDALPDDPLIAMVPVSVRTKDEKDTYGNRVSSVLADLATTTADPVKRLLRIHEAMKTAKRMQEAVPADLLQDFTQFATPALAAQAARVIARTKIADRMNPPFNVVISNVPGPRKPLYCAGAMMHTYYPVSAVAEGQGLNITVTSYLDRLDFGLVACRELVPDVWDLTDYLAEGLEELVKLADRGRPAEPSG